MTKVFVSGCYDMLHSGHVAFFEEAATYGDLYVGIGSDRTVMELKNRRTVNPENERLYMVKALRCVRDAWINSGSGMMDFEKEVTALKPDIFFVNTDGYTSEKQAFCDRLGIRLVVSRRIPHGSLPPRSTTALRQECTIPYRVEMGGGWMDQMMVNSLHPGAVLVLSIEPDIEFNHRSGMATSSRQKAMEMWHAAIPEGDRVELAKILFCVDNPPGTACFSGSQDHLGILLPGFSRLDYDNGYWPVKIQSVLDTDVLDFIEAHMSLVALPLRRSDFNPCADVRATAEGAARLAEATDRIWQAIQERNAFEWGRAASDSFKAQLEMFPNMMTSEIGQAIEKLDGIAYGCKISGSGGGGYLVVISDKVVDNSIKVRACRA